MEGINAQVMGRKRFEPSTTGLKCGLVSTLVVLPVWGVRAPTKWPRLFNFLTF
jgi:hypothetical protein